MKYIHIQSSPVLEFQKLVVDLFDVYFAPRNVIVGRHSVNNVIVKLVQFLEQVQLFPNLAKLGELRSW